MTTHTHHAAHERPHHHHYDAEMLSVEDARDRILSYFEPLTASDVPLLDALGLTLAEDLTAELNIPPMDNSAMDGYAIQAADVASASKFNLVLMPVRGYIAAGDVPTQAVDQGTAVRIMTGAPVPEGADAVVPFEDTDEEERRANGADISEIGIKLNAQIGENIRPAGEDIQRGETAVSKGTELTPGVIGVAASLGRSTVKAIRRPVIAIVSTGDELIEPGEPQAPGKIYNSNAYSIAAMAEKYGAVSKVIGIARDSIESLEAMLAEAVAYDMVVTSAGVSKGDYDVVKDVLAKGGEVALWSVRMRPAKPLAFGALNAPDGRKVPHLGLPGNPVSAMVAFEQFGRPAIRVMLGKKLLPKPSIIATLEDPIHNHDGRRVYARVEVFRDAPGRFRARLTGNQSSGALHSMARARGLAICPDDVAIVPAGAEIEVEILEWPDDDLLSG
jgi:molybdopterin molybdotransferase